METFRLICQLDKMLQAQNAEWNMAQEMKKTPAWRPYLSFNLSLPLLQQLGHHHGSVAARALAGHGPLAQQRHHGVVVR